MQVLCGLQVVFFLFNCQTPGMVRITDVTDIHQSVHEQASFGTG